MCVRVRLHVLLITALTAGISGTLVLVFRRRRPAPPDLAWGLGIGLYNLVALAVLLTALSRVPGTVFFPVHGCAVVILDNLCSRFVWREPLTARTLVGAALGAVSMLLVL